MAGSRPSEPTQVGGRGQPRLARWQVRVVAGLLALAVASAALALYLNAPRRTPAPGGSQGSGSPFVILYERVSEGQASLTLPYMEARNPDNASVKNISFRTDLDFSTGANGLSEINYSWLGESDSGMPVVMEYDAQPPGFPSGPNWLAMMPGGVGWIVTGSNDTALALQEFLLPYTVYRATLFQPSGTYSWLEVRYHLGLSVAGMCMPGAYCWTNFNVTEPTPQDLEVIGPPLVIGVYSGVGQVTPFDVHDYVDPTRVFHTRFPGPSFDAGAYGRIQTSLRSSFAWGSTADQVFSVRGLGNLTMELYIDTRFGNLYPVLLS